jgi:glycerate 2-kinase
MLSAAAGANPRQLLGDLYSAATAAVAPGPALARRLETIRADRDQVWVIALGKAARPMAATAAEILRKRGSPPVGGLVVGPIPGTSPDPAFEYVAGDHPEPGPGSLAAAEALAHTAARIGPDDEVWVLLSGGTTSLIAAPEPGLSAADLKTIYGVLLGSGLDITAMNRVRKRFSRWGGGKLARALAPARVRVYVVSDVIGDDLASIGSGPCVPDPTTATEVHQLLQQADLWGRIPQTARELIASIESGREAETPKPDDPVFASVSVELIASNQLALDAAGERARRLGLNPRVAHSPVSGEAAAAGARLAAELLASCAAAPRGSSVPDCFIWGGETTVSLGEAPTGLGGRCQELALAASKLLEGAPEGVALLAAGTDGRDGPTDAAGAIIDNRTWRTVIHAGRDPSQDLVQHNAYPALAAAGALLRPGLTGTNVMDVMIGLCLKHGQQEETR